MGEPPAPRIGVAREFDNAVRAAREIALDCLHQHIERLGGHGPIPTLQDASGEFRSRHRLSPRLPEYFERRARSCTLGKGGGRLPECRLWFDRLGINIGTENLQTPIHIREIGPQRDNAQFGFLQVMGETRPLIRAAWRRGGRKPRVFADHHHCVGAPHEHLGR